MLADGGFDCFGGPDDLVAGVCVAAFALGHEAGPAAGDEGAGTGASHAGGGVDAAGPVGRDEVLICAELGVSIENDGISFGCKAVFVGIAAYAGDAFETEIERLGLEACAGKKRDEEGAEAAVNVEGDSAFQS